MVNVKLTIFCLYPIAIACIKDIQQTLTLSDADFETHNRVLNEAHGDTHRLTTRAEGPETDKDHHEV